MSAKKFIAELDARKLLSDRVMARLRESLAASRSPLSAEKLATFLVQKNQLSPQQAKEVLNGLTQSGVNLAEEDADRARDKFEDSSVFSPSVAGNRNTKAPGAAGDGDNDELRLVPLDDDLDSAKNQVATREVDDDDLPVLGAVPPVEKVLSRTIATSPEVKPTGRGGAELGDSLAEPALERKKNDVERLSESAATARRSTGLSRGGKKGSKKKGRGAKDKKTWDSPLILIGGGVLVFLLLAGGTITFLLFYQSADQKLSLAPKPARAVRTLRRSSVIKTFSPVRRGTPRTAPPASS